MIAPGDVLKQIALAAGYGVYVWDAIENGDPADSYFWKGAGVSAVGQQSVSTFPSREDAWRDCCEANGLLVPIAHELDQAGWGVFREPGFIAYQWASRDGVVSPERFASAAEALIACVMFLHEESTVDDNSPAPGS
ncbi:MAG: hypothetical protein K2X55_20730 [Burkholderiaceae bacterium]|nr:hypothetical protein [Burkholderiaceae bacterium]